MDSRHSSELQFNAAEREHEHFLKIIEGIENRVRERVHADWKDFSRDPSYSRYELPYFLVCRRRYNASIKAYESQFQREIQQLIQRQGTAYEALRFQRHLAITSLWPPLHSKRQMRETQRKFFVHTPKQLERLNYLMQTKII